MSHASGESVGRLLYGRPAREDDVAKLVELAATVDLGGSKPDRDGIAFQVAQSRNTLASGEQADWHQGLLYLVSERIAAPGSEREIVGSCKLRGAVDACWKVETQRRMVQRYTADVEVMRYTSEASDALELSANVVTPSRRNEKVGKFHTQSRILFALCQKIPGFTHLSANLLTRDRGGRYPFFDHVVRRLLGDNFEYSEADELRYQRATRNRVPLIDELLGEAGGKPAYQFPVHALIDSVRDGLGEVRDETRPAFTALARYGFQATNKYDLLDAGPYVAAELADIARMQVTQPFVFAVADASLAEVAATDGRLADGWSIATFAPTSRPADAFFSARCPVRVRKTTLEAPSDTASLLGLNAGEEVTLIRDRGRDERAPKTLKPEGGLPPKP